MKNYEEWAKQIVRDYGIVGAKKLITELEIESKRVSDEVVERVRERHDFSGFERNKSTSYNNSLSNQISSVESGRITHR